MIAKLVGKVNGQNILLERLNHDMWSGIVPASLDGRMAVDLLAIDEAGNETFWSKWLLTIDPEKLCVHIVPQDYWPELVDTKMKESLVEDDFFIEIIHPICGERGKLLC